MTLLLLTKRNIKLFFRDKGLFFTSLITPIILLVLYATFLAGIYKDSFLSNLPSNLNISDKIVDAFVASQLISSILAVTSITVAFSTNFLMVQDIANKKILDIAITPIRSRTLALSYFIATLFSTLIICLLAYLISLIYLAIVGFYMNVSDVFLLLLDIILMTIFGTALSSLVNIFLKTEGQISAVGAIISAGYGFICGAYMPIASFSNGIRNFIMFVPGTYGTSLIREHTMNGVFNELKNNNNINDVVIDNLKTSFDCNIKFFNNDVSTIFKYLVIIIAIFIFLSLYIIINHIKKKRI